MSRKVLLNTFLKLRYLVNNHFYKRCESTYQFSENIGKIFEKLLYKGVLFEKQIPFGCACKTLSNIQKQPPRGVLRKRCPEDIQQIYRRTPMPKCDSNKFAKQLYEIALRHGCSPLNFLHIFRTPLTKNTSRWLLLKI